MSTTNYIINTSNKYAMYNGMMVYYPVTPAYTSQYQTVYNSFTTKPSASVAAAQNTMVKSLVDNGVWSKLDLFYCFAQEVSSGGEALKNWITPGTYDCTIVGNPSFYSLEGYYGKGITGTYLNTNWNVSTNSVKTEDNGAPIMNDNAAAANLIYFVPYFTDLADISTLYNTFQTYMTSNGKQV